MDILGSIVSVNFNLHFNGRQGVSVNIPNVCAKKFGEHRYSPESLDAGFPVRIEVLKPITVSNILFCTVNRNKPQKVLFNYALKQITPVNGLAIIRIPWKEVDEIARICLRRQEDSFAEDYYVAVFDQFTERAWASSEPFEPFLLDYMAIQCDPDLDKEYAKVLGHSLRDLNRAKTPEERLRIAGVLKEYKKSNKT